MGIEGAAWASLIAQILMALAVLWLYILKTPLNLNLGKQLHFEIRRLLNMTGHLILRSLALNAVLILAVREANAISPEAMAAHTIAINIWLFSAFFIDGFGAAGNLIGGKLLGAKRYFDLWVLTKKVNGYNLIIAGLLMLIGGLTYVPLGRVFAQDPEVLPQFYGVFFLLILIQPFNALAFTLDAIFKGLGEMAFLRNSLFIAAIFGFGPWILATHYYHWGLKGIWWALLAWIVCRALVLMVKFRKDYYPLALAQKN
jgi:multidrug resistance protein, MATE family